MLQLALSLRRSQQRALAAFELPATAKIDARIRRLLPFELTASQSGAIAEIAADMALGRPMNRLLQGDVGSGKTIVALYAMLACVAHGKQAALMAPTEILARQHADTLASLLEASRVKWALLAGGLPKSVRASLLQQAAAGRAQRRHRHARHRPRRRAIQRPRPGGDRRAAQVRRPPARRAPARRSGRPHYLVMTATPDPPHAGHDAVRRSGLLDPPRTARRAASR